MKKDLEWKRMKERRRRWGREERRRKRVRYKSGV